LSYGILDNSGPTSVAVSGSDEITIVYVDGLTNAFGLSPDVDGFGYTYLPYGSGPGTTGGVGNGGYFPSYHIDPGNAGPGQIRLNALIGAFSDGSGVLVASPFVVNNGPLTLSVPSGAAYLLLGVNDDIFGDNEGSLRVSVEGTALAPVPVPASLWLLLLPLAALGTLARRRVAAATCFGSG
jgi:hypothetical protein